MRLHVSILILLLAFDVIHGQDRKPRIVGQKDLETEQGTPITIRLTDLVVEEDDVQPPDTGEESPEPPGNGEDTDDGNTDGADPDPGDGEDTGNDDGSDNDGSDDGSDDDGGQGDPGEGGHHEKGPRGDDKGEKGPKRPKGKKEDKGHNGNGRSAYPDGYTLEIIDGNNYTVSQNTVNPDAGFTGIMVVGVRVRNDTYTSDRFDLRITVQPAPIENSPPKITGQVPLSTPADTPLTITLADLIVVDPDNTYPEGFTMKIFAGDNYSVAGSKVTPIPGFTGKLSVKVTVNDGGADSNPFDLKITVAEKENVSPKIVGQVPMSISINQSLLIELVLLQVEDPDSRYPDDFSLDVQPGEHYTVDHATITPQKDFSGVLSVSVRVNDGSSFSAPYDMSITVTPRPNVTPMITGQTGLKVFEGESLEISFANIVVQDPDNLYPEDFSLRIATGENYSVSGNRVTPAPDFLGVLTVMITVNDGRASSDPFPLKVEVVGRGRLEITAQGSVTIPEDSSYALTLSDLTVSDPENAYPSGFSIEISGGPDYDVSNNTIRPHRDFFGNLAVPVVVKGNSRISAAFSFLVVVLPVNDAPRILNVENDPLVVSGGEASSVTSTLELVDIDDDNLLYADVKFAAEHYQPGNDELTVEASENIHAVFEGDKGVLHLLGQAPVAEYESALRSVKYVSKPSGDLAGDSAPRIVSFNVSDGKLTSEEAMRSLIFQSEPPLDIPSAFTPNNDMVNDTWRITSYRDHDDANAIIRVYDKKGNLVFHEKGLEREWDGQYNGSPLPADVYFYTIEMDLPAGKMSYKGIVSILR